MPLSSSFSSRRRLLVRVAAAAAVVAVLCAYASVGEASSMGQACTKSSQQEDCGSELVCTNRQCTACTETSDCDEPLKCFEGRCVRAKLWEQWTALDTVASIAAFVGAMMAAGGGLGGGGIFVPIFILLAQLSAKDAVPLSQGMIFGGSIVNIAMYYPEKHPTILGKPKIDYNAVLVLQPLMLAGTIVGVILNVIFPGWLIVVTLAVTLSYATLRTARKGRRVWNLETEQRRIKDEQTALREQRRLQASPLVANEHGNGHANGNGNGHDPEHQHGRMQRRRSSQPVDPLTHCKPGTTNEQRAELAELLEEENNPWHAIRWIFLVWAFVSAFNFLRGGKAGSNSIVGIESCSPLFWTLTALSFPVLALVTLYIARRLVRINDRKEALGWQPLPGEITWNQRNAYLYPFMAAIAGLMGGLLGIGGGMIMGPLLLELGMLGQATSATSALTVLLTSSSAALQFLVLDLLLLDYTYWYASLGFVATFLGQTVINHLVKKYKRASIIIIVIALVIGVATVLMVTAGIINLEQDLKAGKSMGFVDFC
eukprot:TRINITY_DN34392_c0_g1_i1.p1 TRINITY_DN34392_c0_g1~~TRINITY_DN34392_c0_g1_i1.p1  ORF type:complete len:551 (+),score=296.05 TRINITY_DN34392_c0_g1_i1:31-1653(+)